MTSWYGNMPNPQPASASPPRNWWQAGTGGAWEGLEPLARTTVGRPSELWQSGALGRMSAQQAANPYWAQTAMEGFTPTYGSYLLGGGQGAFGDWLGQSGNMPGTPGYWTGQNTAGWANAMAASQALSTGAQTDAVGYNPSQIAMMGLLTGENARTNTLAMAQAHLGGGIGMGAMARERALGRLYDVYGARARSATQAPGGFLNWLGGQMATPA